MPAKFVSIDIETTARSPERGQVIEFAAVVEPGDWLTPVEDLPALHCFIQHDLLTGEAEALAMNARIIAELAKPAAERRSASHRPAILVRWLHAFLDRHLGPARWTVAGKNFATFDARFLERLPGWEPANWRHRVIDPAVLWFDPTTDDRLPDTAECLYRAGLPVDGRHEALEDARNVVKLIRRAYARDRFPAKRA